MNTKNNLRYRETEEKILSVFSALMELKVPEKISVAEICKRCGMNRSSFYLHFRDVPDLMDAIERRLAQYYGELFSDTEHMPKIGDRFLHMFTFILERKSFYRAYLTDHQHFRVLDAILPESTEQALRQAAQQLGISDPNELHYRQVFFKAGLTALVREWLLRDGAESPEMLSQILKREYTSVRDFLDGVDLS